MAKMEPDADRKEPNCATIVETGSWCYIDTGSKGRGLFASSDIPPRTILHVAPCIPISSEQYDTHMKFTILEDYLFNDRQTGGKLLALGYGSLFNHSQRPNVSYKVHSEDQTIEYSSGFQVIPQGAELCISYGSNLWFEDAENSGQEQDRETDEEDDDEAFLRRIQHVENDDPNI
jgi:SET domain-containing protein